MKESLKIFFAPYTNIMDRKSIDKELKKNYYYYFNNGEILNKNGKWFDLTNYMSLDEFKDDLFSSFNIKKEFKKKKLEYVYDYILDNKKIKYEEEDYEKNDTIDILIGTSHMTLNEFDEDFIDFFKLVIPLIEKYGKDFACDVTSILVDKVGYKINDVACVLSLYADENYSKNTLIITGCENEQEAVFKSAIYSHAFSMSEWLDENIDYYTFGRDLSADAGWREKLIGKRKSIEIFDKADEETNNYNRFVKYLAIDVLEEIIKKYKIDKYDDLEDDRGMFKLMNDVDLSYYTLEQDEDLYEETLRDISELLLTQDVPEYGSFSGRGYDIIETKVNGEKAFVII